MAPKELRAMEDRLRFLEERLGACELTLEDILSRLSSLEHRMAPLTLEDFM